MPSVSRNAYISSGVGGGPWFPAGTPLGLTSSRVRDMPSHLVYTIAPGAPAECWSCLVSSGDCVNSLSCCVCRARTWIRPGGLHTWLTFTCRVHRTQASAIFTFRFSLNFSPNSLCPQGSATPHSGNSTAGKMDLIPQPWYNSSHISHGNAWVSSPAFW